MLRFLNRQATLLSGKMKDFRESGRQSAVLDAGMNDGFEPEEETRGWDLFSVLLVVVTLALALAVAIPNVIRARTHAARNSCVANLKQIEGAKATWALEQKKEPKDRPAPSDLYGPGLYITAPPECPANGSYTIGMLCEKPTCSLGGPGHSLPSPQRDRR